MGFPLWWCTAGSGFAAPRWAARPPGHADFGIEPVRDCRCRDSGELGGCAEHEGNCDEEEDGAGEGHLEGDEVLREVSSEKAVREQLDSVEKS